MKNRRKRWAPKPRRTDFRVPLDEEFYILAWYDLRDGRISDFAAILMRRVAAHEADQICRYDSAHGFAHLDLLDPRGNIVEKRELDDSKNFKAALAYALLDLKTNYAHWWKKLRQKR